MYIEQAQCTQTGHYSTATEARALQVRVAAGGLDLMVGRLETVAERLEVRLADVLSPIAPQLAATERKERNDHDDHAPFAQSIHALADRLDRVHAALVDIERRLEV